MPPRAPALPCNIIEPCVSVTALTAQDIRALFRNEEWTAMESRRAQLVSGEEFTQKTAASHMIPLVSQAYLS
jgi:hypothetical protein